MMEVRAANLFFLTNPEPGRFFVTVQVKGAHGHAVEPVEISIGQLANFLVDGTRMVLWSQTSQPGTPEGQS